MKNKEIIQTGIDVIDLEIKALKIKNSSIHF